MTLISYLLPQIYRDKLMRAGRICIDLEFNAKEHELALENLNVVVRDIRQAMPHLFKPEQRGG